MPPNVRPIHIGCLDIGHPESVLLLLLPPPMDHISWFFPRYHSAHERGQSQAVDWARPVRQLLSAARISVADHYPHLKLRMWIHTSNWNVVLPSPDVPPPPPLEEHSRGEGGAACGGPTSLVRRSGAPAVRNMNPMPPPPPKEAHSRGQGGAAHGGPTFVDRRSGALALREMEPVPLPATATDFGGAGSRPEQARGLIPSGVPAAEDTGPTDTEIQADMNDYDAARRRPVSMCGTEPT